MLTRELGFRNYNWSMSKTMGARVQLNFDDFDDLIIVSGEGRSMIMIWAQTGTAFEHLGRHVSFVHTRALRGLLVQIQLLSIIILIERLASQQCASTASFRIIESWPFIFIMPVAFTCVTSFSSCESLAPPQMCIVGFSLQGP